MAHAISVTSRVCEKNRPKMWPNPFLPKLIHNVNRGRMLPKIVDYFFNFKTLLEVNNLP
jgi:hypothetical protein